MLVLALDTTTRAGSIAITRDDVVLAVIEGDSSRTHGERMPGEIALALEAAHVDAHDLDLVVVASGPGAFTGLRIGLATAQGLAMAWGTPVVGVSALDALAETAWAELRADAFTPVVAWMDAQRGEVFGAFYLQSPMTTEPVTPTVGVPSAMMEGIPCDRSHPLTFVGDGAVKYASLIRDASHGQWIALDGLVPLTPALSRLGRRLAERGEAGAPHALKPLYVRRPDAELERDRRIDV